MGHSCSGRREHALESKPQHLLRGLGAPGGPSKSTYSPNKPYMLASSKP